MSYEYFEDVERFSTHSLTKRLTYMKEGKQLFYTFQLTASRRG